MGLKKHLLPLIILVFLTVLLSYYCNVDTRKALDRGLMKKKCQYVTEWKNYGKNIWYIEAQANRKVLEKDVIECIKESILNLSQSVEL